MLPCQASAAPAHGCWWSASRQGSRGPTAPAGRSPATMPATSSTGRCWHTGSREAATVPGRMMASSSSTAASPTRCAACRRRTSRRRKRSTPAGISPPQCISLRSRSGARPWPGPALRQLPLLPLQHEHRSPHGPDVLGGSRRHPPSPGPTLGAWPLKSTVDQGSSASFRHAGGRRTGKCRRCVWELSSGRKDPSSDRRR